jgi:hypothetical protein
VTRRLRAMRTKLAALEARLDKHHPEPRRHSLDDYARVIEAITSTRPAMELRFDVDDDAKTG